jgi:glycosyltransferase involved in cell wall biosynthesis
MSKPLITFCVPVFNAVERIGRCLDSILCQDIPSSEREILVVDNCSTDGTLSAVREKLAGIENVRIVRNDTNIGRIENWNRCLELSTGRYVQIVMASDVLLARSAKAKLRAFEEQPDLVLVSSPGAGLPLNGEPYPKFPENPEMEIYPPDVALKLFFEKGPITQSLNCVLFDADMIRKLQLRFDERYPFNADGLFVTHLLARGPVCFVSGPSCLFDASNKNRYYYIGISDADNYFVEHGALVKLVAAYLRQQRVKFRYSSVYLLKRYNQWLSEKRYVGFLAIIRTFAPSSTLILYALAIRVYSFLEDRIPWIPELYRFLKKRVMNAVEVCKRISLSFHT